ncbi:unnamed protein product [Fraxinus pennsylvanica]|uniref:Uncharacterized protein n=1 Tax=Fraxinus pennsylvanica TaxID=56036 RepID=A0AAD2AH24_9LAMI|nr:unnamed protein product [Fraxinus pennsylvanica]
MVQWRLELARSMEKMLGLKLSEDLVLATSVAFNASFLHSLSNGFSRFFSPESGAKHSSYYSVVSPVSSRCCPMWNITNPITAQPTQGNSASKSPFRNYGQQILELQNE